MSSPTKLIAGVLLAILSLGAGCSSTPTTPTSNSSTTSSSTPVATSAIYTFESDANGFNTKTYFYDTGKEVVAFDAQFTDDAAQKAIDFLRTKTKNPITYLVVTHPNPDKFNGMKTFQKAGAKVIMSNDTKKHLAEVHEYKKYYFTQVAKSFTDQTYPTIGSPDITFDTTYDIPLQTTDKVTLTELHMSGVSSNQTIAYIPSQNSVVVGDLIHYHAQAWLEGPIEKGAANFSAENWIKVLEKLHNSYPMDAKVLGGRGEETTLMTGVMEQIAYLKKAEEITRKYIMSLKGELKIKEYITAPSEDIEDKKKAVNYADLTKVFEKEFPNYKLSYMITYGAYGLVASIR